MLSFPERCFENAEEASDVMRSRLLRLGASQPCSVFGEASLRYPAADRYVRGLGFSGLGTQQLNNPAAGRQEVPPQAGRLESCAPMPFLIQHVHATRAIRRLILPCPPLQEECVHRLAAAMK